MLSLLTIICKLDRSQLSCFKMPKPGSIRHRFIFPEQPFPNEGRSLEYQQALEEIIDHLPCYAYWKDLNSVYMSINQNCLEAFNVKSAEDIIGKTDYECPWGLKEPKIATQFRLDDQFVIKTGQKHVVEHRVGILNDHGTEMIIRTEKSPLRNKEGKIIGVLGIAVDVTEQRKLEKELELAKLELATQKFGLTPRELECIGQLLLGKTAIEIAEALTLSTRTVETHLDNIKNKVGCSKKSELIALLLQHGFSAAS